MAIHIPFTDSYLLLHDWTAWACLIFWIIRQTLLIIVLILLFRNLAEMKRDLDLWEIEKSLKEQNDCKYDNGHSQAVKSSGIFHGFFGKFYRSLCRFI